MSLANLIVQPTRAVLQADAAAFLPDGTVAALRPKLYTCSAAKAAFSLRGGVLVEAFNIALSAASTATLADLANGLPDVLRRATVLTAQEQDNTAACLTLIAWCPQRWRPIGMLMTNDAEWFDGKVYPYQWVMVDNCIGSTEALDDLGLTVAKLSDPARFDIDRDSVRLIKAQRARPWGAWPRPDPAFAVAHRIGGWVDQAEVTAAGVTERRLVTWPEDRAGKRIAA